MGKVHSVWKSPENVSSHLNVHFLRFGRCLFLMWVRYSHLCVVLQRQFFKYFAPKIAKNCTFRFSKYLFMARKLKWDFLSEFSNTLRLENNRAWKVNKTFLTGCPGKFGPFTPFTTFMIFGILLSTPKLAWTPCRCYLFIVWLLPLNWFWVHWRLFHD